MYYVIHPFLSTKVSIFGVFAFVFDVRPGAKSISSVEIRGTGQKYLEVLLST